MPCDIRLTEAGDSTPPKSNLPLVAHCLTHDVSTDAHWKEANARAELADLCEHGRLPKRVKYDSRICFALEFYSSKEDAERVARIVRLREETYNGGFYDGMPCGREPRFDYTSPDHGKLFAVSRR